MHALSISKLFSRFLLLSLFYYAYSTATTEIPEEEYSFIRHDGSLLVTLSSGFQASPSAEELCTYYDSDRSEYSSPTYSLSITYPSSTASFSTTYPSSTASLTTTYPSSTTSLTTTYPSSTTTFSMPQSYYSSSSSCLSDLPISVSQSINSSTPLSKPCISNSDSLSTFSTTSSSTIYSDKFSSNSTTCFSACHSSNGVPSSFSITTVFSTTTHVSPTTDTPDSDHFPGTSEFEHFCQLYAVTQGKKWRPYKEMDTSLKQQALELYQPPKCSEDGTLIEGDSLESTIIDLMMVAVIKGKKKYVNKYIDLLGPAKIEQILRIFACEDGRDFQAGNYQLNSMIRELHAHNERAALGYKRIFNPEYFAKKDNIFITELGRRMDREADPKGFKKSIESVYQELDFYADKSYIPKNSNFDKLVESLPVTTLEDLREHEL